MSHEIEFVNGEASHAYVGEVPWHGLGTRVPADLTPEQMLYAAKLDWAVEKVPLYFDRDDQRHETGRFALVRDRDGKMLDVISSGWEPVQNAEAFGFFYDWVNEGDMEMHTAGSLKGGSIVWALAKIKDGAFDAVKGDTVESYLLFSNPHRYGHSVEIRMTNIRVVCNNTLTYALSKKASSMVRLNHSRKFNAEAVKTVLGLTKANTQNYRAKSEFLASKNYTQEQLSEYINRLFPYNGEKEKEFSRPGQIVFDAVNVQPGADLAPGTWWNAFNAVTYSTDHLLGNSRDTRLSSAWFGSNQAKKIEALNVAVEMAGGA